jgi:glutamate racemase
VTPSPLVPSPAAPILVIDSSLAGLGVVRALKDRLPDEKFLFFADLARAPYAQRSPERVVSFVKQICRRVERYRPKHVLITCDVAGAVAVMALRQRLAPIPVSGMIDPAARALAECVQNERPTLGIFAGNWTIEQRTLERAIFRRRTKCSLYFRTTPALDAIINEGRSVEDPLLLMAATQYLEQLIDKGAEAILLANTALASVRRTIQALAGDEIRIVDAARTTAEDVARRLQRLSLSRPTPLTPHETPVQWFVTDESPEIFDRAERLAGFELPPPTIVGLDELDALGPDPRLRSTG